MTAPDTSPEAVEQSAFNLDESAKVHDSRGNAATAQTFTECAALLRALSGELARARECASQPIPIGVGAVRIAICSSSDDQLKVARELVIYDDGAGTVPVGTDLPEHRGKLVPEVGSILARLRILDANGARALAEDLNTVIENARRADAPQGPSHG